jgi:quercetin dioxygenase-like cupin family protein
MAVLTAGLGLVAAAAPAQSPENGGSHGPAKSHILVPADRVQWGPAPPALPPGAKISVLEGSPAEKGPVTLRLQFPAAYTIPPHWHSMTENVTVLSGTLNVGMGDSVKRQASQALAAGGFVSLPANMHHHARTAEPTVVQINLEGPFDIFYVNPADDPQRPQTRR